MTKILIVLDVEDVDTTDTDPHEIVEDVLAIRDEAVRADGGEYPEIRFVSAEWETLIASAVREGTLPILTRSSLSRQEAEDLTMRIGAAVTSKLTEEIR